MTESEFMMLAEQTLGALEAAFERVAQNSDLDIETKRTGNVLEIEFVDKGSKIIINSQSPMQEIWVAARMGGFHYKREGTRWINTRDGSELFSALADMAGMQAGVPVNFE